MDIVLENNTSFEFTVSQLQKLSHNILCVKDGYRLLIYSSESSIPSSLKFIEKINNELINTHEYHYRDKNTDELYVFFKPVAVNRSPIFKVSPEEEERDREMEKQTDNSILTYRTPELVEEVTEIIFAKP